MLPYIFALLTLFFSWFLIRRMTPSFKTQKIAFSVLFFLCICLLFALRHPSMGKDLRYGTDYGYLGAFQRLSAYPWSKIRVMERYLNYEKGYVLFNKLVAYISDNYQTIIIACAIAAIFPVAYFIGKHSVHPLSSALIYWGLPVFLLSFSGLRQAIAIGITLFSYQMIRKRKIVPFVLIVILASYFHKSAILFLVAYPAYRFRPKANVILYRMLTLFGIAVVYFLRAPLFSVLSQLLRDDAVEDNNGAVMLLLVFILIYMYSFLFGDNQDEETNGLMNIFYCACICQTFGGLYATALRVGYYFLIYAILLLPRVHENIGITADWRNQFIHRLCVNGVFTAYGFYAIYVTDWAVSYPYRAFWS